MRQWIAWCSMSIRSITALVPFNTSSRLSLRSARTRSPVAKPRPPSSNLIAADHPGVGRRARACSLSCSMSSSRLASIDRRLVTTGGHPRFDHPASCVSTSRGDGHTPAAEVLVDADRSHRHVGGRKQRAPTGRAGGGSPPTTFRAERPALRRAARLDLRELAGVADQHDLRSCVGRVVEKPGQLRVPTIAASSTTSTVPAANPPASGQSRSSSSRSIVCDGMPASVCSWRAAFAATAQPITGWPAACHASRRSPSEGLARPGDTLDNIHARPDVQICHTISSCSSDIVGRAERAAPPGRASPLRLGHARVQRRRRRVVVLLRACRES